MTLRLRHLRLRAITSAGPYGADIPFKPGLNVIWANNTKGKSTCMQAMLYVLGLEKMLSPRREVPLPHAMTSYLRGDDESQLDILRSWVELEIENGAGDIATVRRAVRDESVDNRLVTVWFGPMLTSPGARSDSRLFFVRDGGAFQREDGFLYFLERFIGWQMPMVRKFEGPEGKLPLETVFPLFWVEQKVGWSAIPAAIPTYMRIREVQKRAVEFIMDLDVHKIELERERLKERLQINSRNWAAVVDEMTRLARRGGGALVGLPIHATEDVETLERWSLNFLEGGEWVQVEQLLSRLHARLDEMTLTAVPSVGAQAEALVEELEALNRHLDSANRRRIEVHAAQQLKAADIVSLHRRLVSLKEDLQKNLDVQKLQRFAGSAGALTPDRCPTCEQALVDALLSQEILQAVMPIEDNIEYIRSQMKMFEDILAREQIEERRLDDIAAAAAKEIAEIYGRMRVIKSDLGSPSGAPSAAIIEHRLRLEMRIRDLEGLVSSLGDAVAQIHSLAGEFRDLQEAWRRLPTEQLTSNDRFKLVYLTNSLRQLAQAFGFSTFSSDELTLDDDSYRPQKEGYEIGFETSASDAIRLKWAYQFGLLELSQKYQTNHPQLLLLDEPRQQSSSKVSFGALLERAASHQQGDAQIIVSTSEDIDNLLPIINRLRCEKTIFDGYILQPIATRDPD
ncbi:ATP-binding protein [Falsiroseomonas selenitidurans]|uniref:Rad50/SbcC-type AAA domain-containing protein n=1 Tax=Falsiroseomonas selenitidurans TaxID=2716335 RepID=A0ABX1DYA7_9PROT|nr:ATP-binding protein [Falsiroseomonas selenitidurans]NKC29894.1 hypothetical protein [Falsiroseomonas selenitidurans]